MRASAALAADRDAEAAAVTTGDDPAADAEATIAATAADALRQDAAGVSAGGIRTGPNIADIVDGDGRCTVAAATTTAHGDGYSGTFVERQ